LSAASIGGMGAAGQAIGPRANCSAQNGRR